MDSEWLVSIESFCGKHVFYIEVLANFELEARRKGLDAFKIRCIYEPVTRQKVSRAGKTGLSFYASEAVQIN